MKTDEQGILESARDRAWTIAQSTDPDDPTAVYWPICAGILGQQLLESKKENSFLAAQIARLLADLAEAKRGARACAPPRPIRFPFLNN